MAGGVDDLAAVDAPQSASYAIIPDDFIGFVAKPAVKEDDKVSAGAPLLYDKRDEALKLVSPVTARWKLSCAASAARYSAW